MKIFASLLAVGMTLLLFAARATHADVVSVQSRPAPAIAPGVWINGKPTTIQGQRGKVVVLLFWTHDCINCKHNLPYWNEWAKRYAGSDVTILSVHTPETASERKIENVRRFVREHGIEFPVVTDNSGATWDAYRVEAWPTEILIDKHGRIRYQYEGELNWGGSGEYKTVEAQIERLRLE